MTAVIFRDMIDAILLIIFKHVELSRVFKGCGIIPQNYVLEADVVKCGMNVDFRIHIENFLYKKYYLCIIWLNEPNFIVANAHTGILVGRLEVKSNFGLKVHTGPAFNPSSFSCQGFLIRDFGTPQETSPRTCFFCNSSFRLN